MPSLRGQALAGALPRLWVQQPHPPLFPRAATGSRLPILSTSCSPAHCPRLIRVAPGQAGQVACSPGAGPGPDNVSEDQPGSAKSSRWAGWRGSLRSGHVDPWGPTSSLPCANPPRWLGPSCPPPMALPGVAIPLAFSPDHPLQPSPQLPEHLPTSSQSSALVHAVPCWHCCLSSQ